MNNRRKFVIALGAGALTMPLASFAQQPGNIPRIGLLWIDLGTFPHYLTAFREGLRAQGYIEGKNIRIEDRFLVKAYKQIPDAAAKLVSEKVTLIVCYGATATQAAAKATSSIPIVMLIGGDPVKLGLADNLSRPGKNVTGSTLISPDIDGKRLEILREAVPGIRRVGVLLSPASQSEILSLRELEAAASKLSLELRPLEVRTPDEIDAVVARAKQLNVQALVAVANSMLLANREQLVAAVAKARLPAIYPNLEFADADGLMAYSANLTEMFRRAAVFADKILKGAKPGELPIEQATTFELVVNMNTAKTLGIKIPNSILVRADRVIE